jgi:23S rRNA (guanosine2251-2'-O)-methyltransferase
MDNIITGRKPIIEALRAHTPIEKIMVLYGVKGEAIERIKQLAKQYGVPCVEVNKQRFREVASDMTTQGVVALIGTKRYVEVEDILVVAQMCNEQPFILILDEIEDPQNLGALLRTAECVGMHGVIIPKHHAASINQTVVKTSAGASEHIAVARVTNIANTIDELKSKGLWIIGVSPEAEQTFYNVDYKSPIGIVIGSEGEGIRRLVKEKCDFLVRIPMFGKIDSLNASVAGALVMYEAVRARRLG